MCCQAHVQVHLCPHKRVHWPAAMTAMANLDLTGIDKILDLWNWAKGQEAAAKKKIEQCRKQVEAFLDDAGAIDLVTAKYKVQKRL